MTTRSAQYGFSGGEIAPQLHGRTDLDKYALSLRVAKNVLISRPGSIYNRAGTEFIGEVRDSADTTRLLPFQFNVTQAYVIEVGDEVWRPIKDGGQVLEAAVSVSAISSATTAVVATTTAHGFSNGDKVFPAAIGGMTQLLDNRVFTVAGATASSFSLVDMWGDYVNSTGYSAYTSGGTFSRLYQLAMPYDQTHVMALDYAQTADTMYVAHTAYATRKITRTAHSAWSISTITWGPTLSAPGSVAASVGSGTATTTLYSYKVASFSSETGEESLPSAVASCSNDLTVAGSKNVVTWASNSSSTRYIIYKEDGGAYGYIGGVEHPATSFTDQNILPDLGDAPQATRDPFTASSAYPGVCSFHGGRLVLACTVDEPGGVWMSQATRYENLNVATPAKADDAVSFVLAPGVNAVRSIVSVGKMAMFTSEREFTADGGGVQEAITPASLNVRKWTRRGSAQLKALEVGDIALYIQRQGARVLAYGYSFEKDGFRSNDLTLLAPHLFRGHTIVDWCYQQDPDSIVWCVRDDGVILALTFIEEQNVFAWTANYLGGTAGAGWGVAESCCAIEGEEQDDVYFVVKRTINGQTKRYIEKLVKRWDGDSEDIAAARFLDSHIVYTNTASTSVIPNLWHLEGQSVSALVDGGVQGPFTVTNGAITLSVAMAGTNADANSQAVVGLAYESDVVDLPLSMQTQSGAPQGRRKSANAVVLRCLHSRGFKYGSYTSQDRLTLIKPSAVSTWSDAETPFSGDTNRLVIDGDWNEDASVLIRQSQPLPMEILMIARDVTVGGP